MSHPLTPLLAPRSVAVVGASPEPRKRGYQAVYALVHSGYAGRVFPVHPSGGALHGLDVVPSVEDLEEPPDVAFVCTRAETVPDILERCAAVGIRGAVIPAVGFRETGPAGEALEARIAEIAVRTGLRLVGPNTSGILNTAIGLNLVGVHDVPRGSIALLAQSGNVALDVMTRARVRRVGISLYVGVGNETDVAFHEYLDYLEQDPGTDTIMVYVEGLRDGRRFLEVARRVTETKPIVLLKGGRSDHGVAAAKSHTGAIAGSYPVLRAALRQHGVSEVLRSDELLSVGQMLSSQPAIPHGTAVAVLSDGGGHAALTADALTELAVPLASLAPTTQERLRDCLGPAAAVTNPVDVAGAADQDPSAFAQAVEALAEDAAVGAVLVVGLFGGYAIRFTETLADAECHAADEMAQVMARSGKALVVHSLFADHRTEALARLAAHGVPVVHSLEVGARCLRAAHARGLFIEERPAPIPPPRARAARAASIGVARRERRVLLMETEVRELLAEYAVPTVPGRLCRSADEVADAMSTANGRVALKVVSPVIPGKTDAGGVSLNVSGKRNALAAFRRIMDAASAYVIAQGLTPDIRGVLLVPMLPAPVAELLVGVKRDPQYGPVLTVGAGGIAVEVLHDTALRGLPVGRDEALAMLDEIRIAKLLRGFRGRPPADRDKLADLILGVSACALAHPELEVLEANPVFAYEDRALAVDAHAVLRDFTERHPADSTRTGREGQIPPTAP